MEKTAAQRLQAIIALMVGAFTFGIYSSSFERRMSAFESARNEDANRVAGLILEHVAIRSDAESSRDRIIYLEAALKIGGR
jgi:hypothetical protein